MSNATPMPHEQLLQILMGIWAGQAVGTFARLKIADAIAAGATSAGAIAERIGANADAVHRLLRGCATAGVVAGTGPYALTPAGEMLRWDGPISLRALLDAETAPGHWLPWGRLDEVVRRGSSVAAETLGSDVWTYYEKNAEEGRSFSEAMTGMSGMAIAAVAGAYTFPPATKVVDVGGAHGAFLAHALAVLPAAKGVLLNLPHVVEGAPSDARIERVAGDFTKAVPAGADLYLLKHILHDWDDATCAAILKNVRAAMAPGAKVVVVEMLIPDDGSPSPAALLDLNMLVMLPGRERTGAEMTALLATAGFSVSKIVPTMSPFSVIEAS